jgi:quercetin dioxygenase-like cupin family protein
MNELKTTREYFEAGSLFINGKVVNIKSLVWNEHPAFKGVYLKHILKGEDTNNTLSCHLVKIDAGCEIGTHNHCGKTELHEVIFGHGKCFVGEKEIDYTTGKITVMPADINHKVTAGDEGLFLFAKFFPALV